MRVNDTTSNVPNNEITQKDDIGINKNPIIKVSDDSILNRDDIPSQNDTTRIVLNNTPIRNDSIGLSDGIVNISGGEFRDLSEGRVKMNALDILGYLEEKINNDIIVSGNKLSVNIDNATIKKDGSGSLYAYVSGIDHDQLLNFTQSEHLSPDGSTIINNGGVLSVDLTGIDHDALLNFVQDEHLLYDGITIIKNVGNKLEVNPINIDHDSLQNFVQDEHLEPDGLTIIKNISNKLELNASNIDHDQLLNFVQNEHIEPDNDSIIISANKLKVIKVNGHTVDSDIPAGAVFTDTQNPLSDDPVLNDSNVSASTVATKVLDDKIQTHIDSTGDSHTYINQDVTTTSTPEFLGVKFATTIAPSYDEGLVFKDPITKEISAWSDIPGAIIRMGTETIVKVVNNSGADITNKIVYPFTVTGGLPDIRLADATVYEKSRPVGIVKGTILNGGIGYVVLTGIVDGMDTSGLTVGVAYLDPYNVGNLTNTKPNNGNYTIRMGAVLVVDPSDGKFIVDSASNEYTEDANKFTGWNTDSNVTFGLNFGIRTITLNPTIGSSFYFYQDGVKYTKTSDSFIWSTAEGIHSIYYNNGLLTETVNPTMSQLREIKRSNPGVVNLYWSVSQNEVIFINDEQHTFDMSGDTKSALMDYHGCSILNGLLPVGITFGDGSLDAHAQFGHDSGYIRNQDIITSIPTKPSTDGFTIYWREGSGNTWRQSLTNGFPVKTTGTGRLAWNENIAGTWQLTEVGDNAYVVYHVVASNTLGLKTATIVGQNQYGSIADARDGAYAERSSLILEQLPVSEIAFIATFIYNTKNTYTNSVKAKIVQAVDPVTGKLVDFIDWRFALGAGGGTGGGGATSFTSLNDTPGGYGGYANDILFVNATEDAIEFRDGNTDSIPEGSSNLYFTDERVDDRAANLIKNGTGLSWVYNDTANTLTGNVSLTPFTTTNLAEGANLYYTETRVSSNTNVLANTNYRNVGHVPLSEKGQANGVATLDGTSKVPAAQLPGYVDDVREYPNFGSLPAIGETSILYVTIDNNRVYRWTGSIYVEVSSDTNDYVDSVSFNTSDGVLTLGRTGVLPNLTVDLDGRYITSYTETDPIFSASPAAGITSPNISNWNAAYNDKINSASFNTGNGIITLNQQDGGSVGVDIDGRYLQLGGGTITGTLNAPTINATSQLQLNGININTAGTLSNVAYLDQANIFSEKQTINDELWINLDDDTQYFRINHNTRGGDFRVRTTGGSAERLNFSRGATGLTELSASGVNVLSGGYQVSGTTVIDASRNIVNAGSGTFSGYLFGGGGIIEFVSAHTFNLNSTGDTVHINNMDLTNNTNSVFRVDPRYGIDNALRVERSGNVRMLAGDVEIGSGNLTVTGTTTASSFSGSGASLTSLNASNISSGALADARLSSNVALKDINNNFNTTQSGTIFNATSQLQLNGASINTAGTLSNVWYKSQLMYDESNVDATPIGTIYYDIALGTQGSFPSTFSTAWYLGSDNASRGMQIASSFTSNNKFWVRGRTDAPTSWKDWVEIYHSGNANKLNVDWTGKDIKANGVLTNTTTNNIAEVKAVTTATNTKQYSSVLRIENGTTILYNKNETDNIVVGEIIIDSFGNLKYDPGTGSSGSIYHAANSNLSTIDWNARQFISSVATGTQPYACSSTTLNTNLNADLLDGQHGSYYRNASNINTGTLSDSYLSSNVALTNVAERFTNTLQVDGRFYIGTALGAYGYIESDSSDFEVRSQSNSSYVPISFTQFNGTTTRQPFTINTSGNGVFTGTVTASNFILGSDETLKNINGIATIDVDDIPIIEFTYKNDKTNRKRYGVSAQTLQQIAPEMVYEDNDKYLHVAYIDFLVAKCANQDKKIRSLEDRINQIENCLNK